MVFQESVYNKLDDGSAIDVIYLDLQKGFDKAPHVILMDKLKKIGTDRELANWIDNWLSNRTQRVVIRVNRQNGSKSIVEFHKGPF